jgi:hypothetical protein
MKHLLGELSEEKKEEIWNVFSKIMNKIKQNDFLLIFFMMKI